MKKPRKKLTPEEKRQKKLEQCSQVWSVIKEELKISDDLSDVEKIHKLVYAANDLQSLICTEADKINIEGFEKAEEMLTIDKSTWSEFVKTVAKKLYGNLSEKALEKLNNGLEKKRYLSNLRQSFYDSYLADETLKIVDEAGKSDSSFDEVEDTEFAEHIEECAKIRDYINNVLYKQYNALADAAFFVSNGKLERKDFKDLVDWEHYKDSEDPKFPSRSWPIYQKFDRMVRLMTEWEFDQLKDLNHEFGINPQLGTPHPVTHPWQVKSGETLLD
jgi:hypothetical protein